MATEGPGFTIDSTAVRDIVARGIIEAIGPEQRDLMIKAAVDHLLVGPELGYGRGRGDSPLQIAFHAAVREAAGTVVREMLSEPDVAAQVDASIREKVAAMLSAEGGWLYSTIGTAVGDRVQAIMEGRQ